MCFIISAIDKTKRKIVCFKILRISKDGIIQSPYYMTFWVLNKEQKTKLVKRPSKNNTKYNDVYYSSNGFYTYENISIALRELRKFERRTKAKFKIFRCIIPKDTKCYFGQGQICSERLIIKRKSIFNLIGIL